MRADPRLRVAIVGDDRAHMHLTRALADAVVRARVEGAGRRWPEPDNLHEARVWHLHDGQAELLRLHDLDALIAADARRLGHAIQRTHRVDGQPVGPLGNLADACVHLALSDDPPDVVLGLVDGDSRAATAQTLRALESVTNHARKKTPALKGVVFGVTVPCAEGWLVRLLGLDAAHAPRRATLKAALGFDPVATPERLNTTTGQARHAKRVLRFLLDTRHDTPLSAPDDTPKEALYAEALRETALSPSEHTGLESCGLAPFVEALERDYAPAVVP